MSARSYQLKLNQALILLSESQKAAQEWRIVAENRLKLIIWIDGIVDEVVKDLVKVGTIFGVDPSDPGIPLASIGTASGDEASQFVNAKIDAISSFAANLAREARSLQSTLDDTLMIAINATMEKRPTEDLKLSMSSKPAMNRTSPLKEVFNELEDTDMSDEESCSPREDSLMVVQSQGSGSRPTNDINIFSEH